MDIKTTNHFRQLLLKLQSATEELEVISKDSGKPVQLDQSMVGRLSRMDAIQVAEMAQTAQVALINTFPEAVKENQYLLREINEV